GWVPALISTVLLVWFAAALAGLVAQPAARIPGLTRAGRSLLGRPGTPARFLFGAVTGLLPCGMVYAALGLAVAAAHPLTSAATMLAFGAATVPGLTVLSLGVQRLALRSIWARRAMAAVILVAGLWSVGARSAGLHAGDGVGGGHGDVHGSDHSTVQEAAEAH
ncbi:MAG TPA: sulfite exporter TauE/SafE family protein, partial [Longimicrobiales bacterium]|nr:sulfite exporter TauE/SafE family protein [Longimicrobiales bacterium]